MAAIVIDAVSETQNDAGLIRVNEYLLWMFWTSFESDIIFMELEVVLKPMKLK